MFFFYHNSMQVEKQPFFAKYSSATTNQAINGWGNIVMGERFEYVSYCIMSCSPVVCKKMLTNRNLQPIRYRILSGLQIIQQLKKLHNSYTTDHKTFKLNITNVFLRLTRTTSFTINISANSTKCGTLIQRNPKPSLPTGILLAMIFHF